MDDSEKSDTIYLAKYYSTLLDLNAPGVRSALLTFLVDSHKKQMYLGAPSQVILEEEWFKLNQKISDIVYKYYAANPGDPRFGRHAENSTVPVVKE